MDRKTRRVYDMFQKWGEGVIYGFIKRHNLNINIAFGIIDDPAIRAFTTKTNEGYLIGVNAGTVHYFYNYCKAMTSSRYAFPHIDRRIPNIEFNVDPRQVAIYSPIEQVPYDENEEIKILGSNMFSFCASFIINHELMHILGGHLDYYIQLGGRDLIDAPLGLLNQGLSSKAAQAMEFWADGMSFYRYMMFAINRASVPAWPIENWLAQGNLEVPAGPFSAYAVFRALSPIEQKYNPLTSSHPPTHMRARFLQLLAVEALRKTSAPLQEALRDFVVTPMRCAFNAYNDIAGTSEVTFDELVQSDECLELTLNLKKAAETFWFEEWKKYALVQPSWQEELRFGAGN